MLHRRQQNIASKGRCVIARLFLPQRTVHIRAVGLDVDGVLRNTGHASYLAECKALKDFGIEPPTYEEFVGKFENDLVKYYGLYGIGDHRAIQERFLHYVGETDKEEPFGDVLRFLIQMRNCNVGVFAVSGHPTHKLHGWFAEHGIDIHLRCVYGGSKDKRACLRSAFQDLHTDPKDGCYIGDWGVDMRAANAVGTIPIGITRGHNSRKALVECGASHVVEHLHEFGGLIE